MGFLSKVWKGVKGVVKKAAKTIKKTAKKIAYAIPGGKQLWDLSSKIGKGAMKVVGKITSALGPVGMIALSVLAPYAAPLWASFGAAASASALAGSALGTIGSAIYTAGNWVAGTLGAMSSGISKAIGTIAEGGFSGIASGSLGKAGSQAVSGFAKAFSGAGGAQGIATGVQAATDFAIKEAAGQTLFDQTVSKITGDVTGSAGTQIAETTANDTIEQSLMHGTGPTDFLGNPIAQASPVDAINSQIASGQTIATDAAVARAAVNESALLQSSGGSFATKATGSALVGTSLKSKAGDVAKTLLSSGAELGQYDPIQGFGDVGGINLRGNSSAEGGFGSGGGGFLSQAMLAAMQKQQERMTRGFG